MYHAKEPRDYWLGDSRNQGKGTNQDDRENEADRKIKKTEAE